jgi:SulP family sulfate permease
MIESQLKVPIETMIITATSAAMGIYESHSIHLKSHPLSANIVMMMTVIVVVWTHNLAYGVFVGVLLASLFFANKIAHFMYVESAISADDETRTYVVHGQVFFNSADKFTSNFDGCDFK